MRYIIFLIVNSILMLKQFVNCKIRSWANHDGENCTLNKFQEKKVSTQCCKKPHRLEMPITHKTTEKLIKWHWSFTEWQSNYMLFYFTAIVLDIYPFLVAHLFFSTCTKKHFKVPYKNYQVRDIASGKTSN